MHHYAFLVAGGLKVLDSRLLARKLGLSWIEHIERHSRLDRICSRNNRICVQPSFHHERAAHLVRHRRPKALTIVNLLNSVNLIGIHDRLVVGLEQDGRVNGEAVEIDGLVGEIRVVVDATSLQVALEVS